MYPHYFGQGHQLFGWYHKPAVGHHDVGVVIVPPNGYDVICMHWGWRKLAERLSGDGFPVLRFDLHGTADSAGDDNQPDRVSSWLASIEQAINWVKEIAGVSRVVLIGARLGGTLAAQVSSRDDVVGIVLYAPCVSGRLYVRELKALAAGHGEEQGTFGYGVNDVVMAGWLLREATVVDVSKLDISKLSYANKQMLYFHRHDMNPDQRLLQALQTSSSHEVIASIEFAEFSKEAMVAKEPVNDFARIHQWLLRLSGGRLTNMIVSPVLTQRLEGECYSEMPVRFGFKDGFFGVLCQPKSQVANRCIIFVSTAANHHIGTHRMFVYLARELAKRGIASFRMDVAGIGDSACPSGRVANEIYSVAAVADVQAAIDAMINEKCPEIVLCGVCSGAYLAYQTAIADKRVKTLLCFNLFRFIWRDTDSLTEVARTAGASVGEYMRRALQWATWKRFFTGDVDIRYVVPLLWHKLGNKFKGIAHRITALLFGKHSANPVLASCMQMLQRGSRFRLVYSEGDVGLEEVMLYLGSEASELKDQDGFEFALVADADHTFTRPHAIQAILEQCAR